MGKAHGVAILSEALVERFDPKEVAELEDADRDAQGNIRVTEVDLGRKVINEVTAPPGKARHQGERSSTRRLDMSCDVRRLFPWKPSMRAISDMPPSSTFSRVDWARS